MGVNSPLEGKSIPGPARVSFTEGRGDLPMLEVTSRWSTAEIYPHGAHVTYFGLTGESPLLFLSQCSRFSPGEPIRGGVPVIFPWFGPREGLPQHGFARLKPWELKEVQPDPDGSVSVRFQLPDCPEASAFPRFSAEYTVTVGKTLRLQLSIANRSADDILAFENCLHTYFTVGDVNAVSITGLKGIRYLDKVANFAEKVEQGDAIRISSEVDRVFLDTPGTVEIRDPSLNRRIVVEKQGSASTVVWNPWVIKSQQMPDFGNDEYQRMVCVESGNVASNTVRLPPGQTSNLVVHLSAVPF